MNCYKKRTRKLKEDINAEHRRVEYQRKLDAMSEEERAKYLKDREERLKRLAESGAVMRAIVNSLYDTPFL